MKNFMQIQSEKPGVNHTAQWVKKEMRKGDRMEQTEGKGREGKDKTESIK